MTAVRRAGPVVFVVLSHRNPTQIRHLVRTLAAGDDTFVLVHHDRGGEPLDLSSGGNVHVVADPLRMQWGRMTLVQATWDALDWVRANVPEFGWITLASGQDYPAMPVTAIEQELRATAADGFMRHLRLDDDPSRDTDPWQALARRRYLRKVRLPRSHRSVPLPVPRPNPFGPGFHLYAGEMWWTLSREAVSAVLDDRGRALRLQRYLDRGPIPDEAFFQTLVVNQPGLSIVQNRRRFIVWSPGTPHPATLTRQHVPALVASGDFLARKFDESVNPGVLDAIDAALAAGAPHDQGR